MKLNVNTTAQEIWGNVCPSEVDEIQSSLDYVVENFDICGDLIKSPKGELLTQNVNNKNIAKIVYHSMHSATTYCDFVGKGNVELPNAMKNFQEEYDLDDSEIAEVFNYCKKCYYFYHVTHGLGNTINEIMECIDQT